MASSDDSKIHPDSIFHIHTPWTHSWSSFPSTLNQSTMRPALALFIVLFFGFFAFTKTSCVVDMDDCVSWLPGGTCKYGSWDDDLSGSCGCRCCTMGKYSDSTRSNDEECMLCLIGSYSPLPMSGALNTDCTTCESGKVMPVPGAGTCVDCESGNTSAQKCVCGAGKGPRPSLP